MNLALAATEIEGVQILHGNRRGDARGFLERLFCENELAAVLGARRIVQVNHTRTEGRGTVRGLHFQLPPSAEMKFIHCLSGRIFDVAVDLRARSSTLHRWHGEVLDGEEAKTLVVPEGVAHGFQLLSDACDLIYLHTAAYDPKREGGVDATDPVLAIAWPLPVERRSERDEGLPRIGAGAAEVVL